MLLGAWTAVKGKCVRIFPGETRSASNMRARERGGGRKRERKNNNDVTLLPPQELIIFSSIKPIDWVNLGFRSLKGAVKEHVLADSKNFPWKNPLHNQKEEAA